MPSVEKIGFGEALFLSEKAVGRQTVIALIDFADRKRNLLSQGSGKRAPCQTLGECKIRLEDGGRLGHRGDHVWHGPHLLLYRRQKQGHNPRKLRRGRPVALPLQALRLQRQPLLIEARYFSKSSVSNAVMENRGHRSDQGKVWAEVARQQSALGASSDTHAMSDTFDTYKEQVADFREKLRYVDEASGMAVAIGKKIVAVDLFDKPSTCGKVWDRLMSGYVLGCPGAPGR